jgi:integrase
VAKRKVNRLDVKKLTHVPSGLHADGNGLYLDVQDSGSRSWILRVLVCGKPRSIGLGGYPAVSLADARVEAVNLRAQARKGEDIMATRREEKRVANMPTFRKMAMECYKAIPEEQSNQKEWLASMENHVFPYIGDKTVDMIDTPDIDKVMSPTWTKIPDAARKIFRRIRVVMAAATNKGFRSVTINGMTYTRPNPCDTIDKKAWGKQPKAKHHKAVPYRELPAHLQKIRALPSSDAVKLALEFTMLTVTRTSETVYARKTEVDRERKVWTVPLERDGDGVRSRGLKSIRGGEMEEREPFEVPLTDRCIEIIDHMEQLFPDSEFIFPNGDGGPQSNLAMLRAVQRHIDRTLTNHGLRATFKTWAHEKTEYDHLVIEACLAHQVDGIERHYLRTSFPEKRRQLMEEWARYVTGGAVADRRQAASA